MSLESAPNKGEGAESLPLFSLSPSIYLYRVSYRTSKNTHTIIYNSIHELILNLSSFGLKDKVTYVLKSENKDFITVTVRKLRLTLSESLLTASSNSLERLYLRLLITNRYGSVSDRGRYLFYDHTLRQLLRSVRGGVDGYLSYENRRVIFRMKCRRLSAVFAYATILDWNQNNDIHINFVNVPHEMANTDLMVEALFLHLRRDQIKMYDYRPIPEADNDQILPTEISSELIQIFNQLFK